MKAYLIIITALVLGTAVFLGFSTRKEPKKQTVVGDTVYLSDTVYYYYPKANVYYSVVKGDYFFLDNDGKTWLENKQLTEDQKKGLDTKVLLRNPVQPVWRDNEQHRIIYAVALYASPADLKEEPVKGHDSKKGKATIKASSERNKETGIKKFFKKIFKE